MQVEARGGSFVLGPTHEEVVTVTVGAEVDSYRQLPLTVYQIQVKFRDEARPRFGLLRTRELIMADAYSFDVDKEAMQASYRTVYDAYLRIFDRLGLDVSPVEAESGAIGGDVNHEFMVPSAVGEDHFVRCPSLRLRGQRGGGRPGRLRRPGRPPTADGARPWSSTTPRAGPASTRWWRSSTTRRVTHADLLKCLAVVDADGRRRPRPGPRRPRGPPARRRGACSRRPTSPPTRPWSRATSGRSASRPPGSRVVADVGVARPGPWITGANRARPPPERRPPRPRLQRRRVGLVTPRW